MSHASSPPSLPLKDHFTWYEKLIARGCLGGAILVAAIAMYLDNPAVTVGYLVLAAFGGAAVVYDFLCVYCPYPFRYSDCLFFPHQLLSTFAGLRSEGIDWLRKAGMTAVFAAIFAVPQYWLWGRWGLLTAFWGLTLPLAMLIPLHICRRCRHEQCPMNCVHRQ